MHFNRRISRWFGTLTFFSFTSDSTNSKNHRWQSHADLPPQLKHKRQIARKLTAVKTSRGQQTRQPKHSLQMNMSKLKTENWHRWQRRKRKTLKELIARSKTCTSSARRTVAIANSLWELSTAKSTYYHLQNLLSLILTRNRKKQGCREVSNKLEHKTHSGDKGMSNA